jgi:hypothetical protein
LGPTLCRAKSAHWNRKRKAWQQIRILAKNFCRAIPKNRRRGLRRAFFLFFIVSRF